ncbi:MULTISPECIES: hypothetical protein [unclassified Winogradskyella]|jgi:LysM repeat protein|uniref:hypothetical protein n=1 Tax=unclassified Winogradskyella TaxID=2615021 RepID=UPI0018E01007|nr:MULTISPECIES: hypothetical protein [unclassified Winogradskyella]
MVNKINEALEYYKIKQEEILNIINKRSNLSVDEIIKYGEEMSVIENKMTALEVAKEN